MPNTKTVSQEEWLDARKKLLEQEKLYTQAGDVFHTYSAYARGLDIFNGAYHLLDMTPKGRDEDQLEFTMAWVCRRDQYGE